MKGHVVIWAVTAIFLSGCVNEVLKGQVEQSKEVEQTLQTQLADARQSLADQDRQNQDLVQKQAQMQRDLIQLQTDLTQRQSVLASENQQLAVENQELHRVIAHSEKKWEMQNVAFQRSPSVTIVPNNSEIQVALVIDDPDILPPRREGGNLIIELQDDLLFKKGTLELSDDGKIRLQKIAEAVRRTYPNALYNIVGHTDDGLRNTNPPQQNLNQKTNNVTENHKKVLVFTKAVAEEPSRPSPITPSLSRTSTPDGKPFSGASQERLDFVQNASSDQHANSDQYNGTVSNANCIQKNGLDCPVVLDESFLQEYSMKKGGIVLNFLIQQSGVRRNQLILTACGSVRPVVSNETEINRQRNRRVEWVILNAI